MLEEGRIPEGMLPEGESEFSRESEDKNFTKVVIDTEHNKAFLTEMAEKLKNINSEEDAEKLKNIFKTMTGVDYDELCKQNEEKELAEDEMPPKELPPEPVPLPEEKPTDDGLDEKVIEEPPKELSLTEREYHEKTINQLDEYLQNPEKLKFTDDEIAEMRQLGVFDRETLIVLVEQLHEDIDNIIAGETDPFSIYFDPEVRKKAIKDTLEIKVSAQEAIDASKDLINSGAVQKVFESKFPKYTARGPAAIMEEFLEYLNRRTVTENECQFLYHELNSTKKLKEIIDNANEKLFENMKTTDGKPFTVSHFVGNIFRWNRSRLALLTGIEENEVKLEKFDSIILIFVVLFVRSWYKKYAPNAQTNSLERRLFFQWLSDNSNPTLLDGEKVEWLDAAWNAVWEKCADISLKSSQKLQDQPKTS